jgi:hypothetical protein
MNTYIGMGYNQHHIIRIGFRFEVNSYSTQVAQLQLEYIWIRQSGLEEQDMDQGVVKMVFDGYLWT